ncbi:MAG TPA: hypothetical protein VH186_03465 [Chloroflexia bacterium]|nr:hypothetical protein [Chloroflexia bacterium]
MQILMDVKELRRIRARWFKLGIFFTLTLGLAMAFALSTAAQGMNTDNKIISSSDFKTVNPKISTYSTPIAITKEAVNPTQTGPFVNDWGVVWLVAFFTFFTATMIAVIISYQRSKARQREISSKPDGFWDWNGRE